MSPSRSSNCRLQLLLLGASLAVGPFAWAQDNQDDNGASEDSALEFGSGVWLPSLQTRGYYTNNFYNSPTNGEPAYGALLNPGLGYRTEAGRWKFSSAASGEYGAFDLPGSADDYLDAQVSGQLGLTAGTRTRFELTGKFNHEHDSFGTDRTEDPSVRGVQLDRWNQASGGMRYRFGAAGAAINAEIGVSGMSKHYISNQSQTRPLDYNNFGGDYALFYNFSPKTSVLIDFSRFDVEFDSPFPDTVERRDGVVYRVRTGARWLATAKTSGDVRVGIRRRTFDDGEKSLEGIDWQAGVQWAARPKTLLELRAGRSEQESYLSNTRLIDLKSASLGWTQTLTSRVKSTLDLRMIRASFIGSTRRDDIYSGILDINYLLRSYLSLQGRVEYSTRDSSSAAARDYDRVNGYIGLRLGR